jgi:hypothetical protein
MESSSSETHDSNDASFIPQQRRLFVHVRPLNSHEINRRSRSIIDADQTTSTKLVLQDEEISEDSTNNALECDGVFQETTSIEQMYPSIVSGNETESTMFHQLLNGYNCSLVFYSADFGNASSAGVPAMTTNNIQHQLIQDLFQNLRDRCAQQRYLQCSVQCSILEILEVNGLQRMRDLIHPPNPVFVGGATTVSCICAQDVWQWMQRASTQRYFRPPVSSNTVVVQLQFQFYDPSASLPEDRIVHSHLQIVDVIDTCECRNDKLARLLRALSSNAHSTLLCTISPGAMSWKETVHSLQMGRAWLQSFTRQTSVRHSASAVKSSFPIANARKMDLLKTIVEIKESDQLRADMSIVQSQYSLLQQKESQLQAELLKKKNDFLALQQRKLDVDYQLRISQFRENEAVVFLRQMRRFYFRLLQKIALEASSNVTAKKKTTTNDHLRSLLERIPGAPDSVQLMDFDQLMMESGLLESSEIGEDINSLELPVSAMQRSAQQMDLMTEQQTKLELDPVNSVEHNAIAAVPLALSSAPAASVVSTTSQDTTYRHPNRERPETVEARQKLYQTPAGRCIALREKLLEEELLQMTELNHQLRQCLIKEQCSVEALTDKLGIEVAFDRMRDAQEVRRAHDSVERNNNDLKAVIWKMNELHMVGKTLSTQLQHRDQHILYLEEKLISLQNQNDTLLMSHQATEHQMRNELQATQTQLSALTMPPWHLSDAVQANVPMPSRILVPFHSRSNEELTNDDLTVTDLEQWIASTFDAAQHQEEDDSKFVEVATQTEDDDDLIASLHMSQRITEDTLDNLLFMDSPIDRSIQRSIDISSSIIVDSRSIDEASSNFVDTLQPALTILPQPRPPPFVDTSHSQSTKSSSLHERADEQQSSSSQGETNLVSISPTLSTEMSNAPAANFVNREQCPAITTPVITTATSLCFKSTTFPISKDELCNTTDSHNSYDNPIDVCMGAKAIETTANLDEPYSPARRLMNNSKSESPSPVTRKSPVPKKLSSFLDRLQKQTQRKLESDEKSTTPEFLKMFNRIGSKNKNETVLETAGAAPARDATRTSFEQLRRGSMSTSATRVSPDVFASTSSTKKWTPRKPKEEGSDSDDSFAKGFMSGAQIAPPIRQQHLPTNAESTNYEENSVSNDDDSDSDDSFARSFMKGAQIAVSSCQLAGCPENKSEYHESRSLDKSDESSSESNGSAEGSAIVERKMTVPVNISRNSDSDSDDSSDDDITKGMKSASALEKSTEPLSQSICHADENSSIKPENIKSETGVLPTTIFPVAEASSNSIGAESSLQANTSVESNLSPAKKLSALNYDESFDSSLKSRPTAMIPPNKHLGRSIKNDSDSDSTSDDEVRILPAKHASAHASSLRSNSDSESDADDAPVAVKPKAPVVALRISSSPFHKQKSDSEDTDDSSDDDSSIVPKTSVGKKAAITGPASFDNGEKFPTQAKSLITRCLSRERSESDSSDSCDEKMPSACRDSDLDKDKSEPGSDDSSIKKSQKHQMKISKRVDSDDESSSSNSQTFPQKQAKHAMTAAAQKKKDQSSSDSSSRFETREKTSKGTIGKTSQEEGDSALHSAEKKSQKGQKSKSVTNALGASGLSNGSKANKSGDDKSTKSRSSKAQSTKSKSKEKSSPAFIIQDGKLVKKVKGASSDKISNSKPAFSIVNGKLVKTKTAEDSAEKSKKKKKATAL